MITLDAIPTWTTWEIPLKPVNIYSFYNTNVIFDISNHIHENVSKD